MPGTPDRPLRLVKHLAWIGFLLLIASFTSYAIVAENLREHAQAGSAFAMLYGLLGAGVLAWCLWRARRA